MTIQVNGTPSPQQKNNPQGLNPQQQQLVDLGIPKEIVLQGDMAIEKYAATKGIQLPQKAAQTASTTTVNGLQAKAGATQDQVTISGKKATVQDELRREGEKYRQQINQDFVNDAKDYSKKAAAFDEKQAEVNQLRARLNTVSKKTMKKEIEVEKPDGSKVKMNKAEAREQAQAALDKAEAELLALRKERDEAKQKLDSKHQLSAANQYNVDTAEGAAAKRQASKTDVDDYLTSTEGRNAVKDNLITTADGTPLVDKEGKPFKRGSDERTKAYDAIQAEYKKSGNPISRKGARRIYKARTKDYSSMEKEDALEKIIIGNKDAYKAEREKADFDKDMPSVTYMSEDLYAKAQKFAKSRGVELPSLEDAKKNGLTGKQLEQFQQLLMDEAGDVGSRLDAKERKALNKDYKDISYADFRKMFTAGNVDVQKTYSTAAAVAGVVAGAGTDALLGITDIVPGEEGFSLGLSGITGGNGSGSSIIDKGEDWVPGTPGSNKFNWLHAGISAGVGTAVAMGIKAVANYDPNGFHKGVTLEQYVYNELDKDEAFKKLAPNVKATMAKVIAENPNMSKDEIFAACDRALGDANERINLRESVGADASLRALRQRQRQEIPQDEIKPELGQATVWDVNDGEGFVDENGNAIDITGATIVQDNTVTNNNVEQNAADGLAYDQKVVGKDKRNTANAGTFAQVRDRSNTDASGTGRLTNQNVQTHRSQYIIADDKGETNVNIGSGSVQAPEELTFKDNTNNVVNEYKYKKLSNAEVTARGLKPEDGPFYELQSATGQGGKDITKTKGKIFKLHFTQTDRTAYKNEVDADGYTTKRTQYTVSTPHYDLEAADHLGQSSPHYGQTGAKPDNK